MSDIKTVSEIKLFDNYKITADKLNLILSEKYEKRDGKGKNAQLTGEYDYREIGYYGTFSALAKGLIKHEVIRKVSEVNSLEELLIHIEKLEKQLSNQLNEKVVLQTKEANKK